MNSIKIKKERLKNLIKEIIQIEKKYHDFFEDYSVLDYCDITVKHAGFSIYFSTLLPTEIMADIQKVFQVNQIVSKAVD